MSFPLGPCQLSPLSNTPFSRWVTVSAFANMRRVRTVNFLPVGPVLRQAALAFKLYGGLSFFFHPLLIHSKAVIDNARTVCQQQGCGRPYLAHAPLATGVTPPTPAVTSRPAAAQVARRSGPSTSCAALNSSAFYRAASDEFFSSAMVPARAGAATPWGTQVPQAMTADARRRKAAMYHTPFGPSVGAQFPRGAHRAYSAGTRTGSSQQVIRPPPSLKPVKFMIWPVFINLTSNYDLSWDPVYAPLFVKNHDGRLLGNEDAQFFAHAQKLSLIFTFPVPVDANGQEDRDYVFHQSLDTCIKEHMSQHGLLFTGPTDPTSESLVSSSQDNDVEEAMQVTRYEWLVLAPGNKPRTNANRKLSIAGVNWYDFKMSSLGSRPWGSLPDPFTPNGKIFFIGKSLASIGCLNRAKRGPIMGRLLYSSSLRPHMCFGLRFLHTNGEIEGEITCQPNCTTVPAAQTLEEEEEEAPTPLFLEGAVDSDQEDEQMREALALSLRDNIPMTLSSSTPGAGPSHRPLPRVPIPALRPRSISWSPPPATRQRLLSHTDSPAPQIASSQPVSVEGWADAMGELLGSYTFRVTAPTTEVAVTALSGHFASFYGAPPLVFTNDHTRRASIESRDPLGPFTQNHSFGRSIGDGVSQTALSELVRDIFSDSNVWQICGGMHVIKPLPLGVLPSDEYLWRVRVCGYVCRLYVVRLHELPPSLSIPFAYAALAGEEAFYDNNPSLQSLLSEAQLEAIRTWPQSIQEFALRSKEPYLQQLAIEHFDKQAEEMAALDSGTYNNMLEIFYRRVVFGFATPLVKSLEFVTFRDTFNGPISDSPHCTLAQSFGKSLQRLLPKMAGNRLKSVEDLIERFSYTSCGVADVTPAQRYTDLKPDEEKYKLAFNRYLRGHGRADHRAISASALSEAELAIDPQDPLIRSLMFLMSTKGTRTLPPNGGLIEMTFVEKFHGDQVDPAKADASQNSDHWLDYITPVLTRTCFDTVEIPLSIAVPLLKEELPNDLTTVTDFDGWQYILYRPYTKYAEFGGVLWFVPTLCIELFVSRCCPDCLLCHEQHNIQSVPLAQDLRHA
ncbi:hypothetical protein R3P38DRAFT_3250383 [Favolaschia claudopus]|uniref:Uncharacterized protein n=1 Tax=Favolaschia claudopus TaxID=2862362 RepID=A0AAW0EK54_9AGAR